jgi:hypothetical protein
MFIPRHPECKICVHFRPETGSVHCLDCGAGENFEENIDDQQPDDDALMAIYANMEEANEDP